MEAQLWAMYFASVTSFQFHPGARRDGAEPLSIPECAVVADFMLTETLRRFPWVGQLPQAQ
jgi:hypothetical protein